MPRSRSPCRCSAGAAGLVRTSACQPAQAGSGHSANCRSTRPRPSTTANQRRPGTSTTCGGRKCSGGSACPGWRSRVIVDDERSTSLEQDLRVVELPDPRVGVPDIRCCRCPARVASHQVDPRRERQPPVDRGDVVGDAARSTHAFHHGRAARTPPSSPEPSAQCRRMLTTLIHVRCPRRGRLAGEQVRQLLWAAQGDAVTGCDLVRDDVKPLGHHPARERRGEEAVLCAEHESGGHGWPRGHRPRCSHRRRRGVVALPGDRLVGDLRGTSW